jgi:hypothetical protein
MCIPFNHHWDLVKSEKVEQISNITNNVVKIWHVHTLICKKCGDVKTKKTLAAASCW